MDAEPLPSSWIYLRVQKARHPPKGTTSMLDEPTKLYMRIKLSCILVANTKLHATTKPSKLP